MSLFTLVFPVHKQSVGRCAVQEVKIIKTGTVKRAMKTIKKLNDRIITLMWKVSVISERDS